MLACLLWSGYAVHGFQKFFAHTPPPPTAALQNPFPAELSLFSAVIPRGGCRYAFSDRVKPTFNNTHTPARRPEISAFHKRECRRLNNTTGMYMLCRG